MTKQTKLLLGVGTAILAYLLWKNSKKTADEKPKILDAGYRIPYTIAIPKSQADCPKGKVFNQPHCKQAPCPASCVDGITYVQDHTRPKEDHIYGYDGGYGYVGVESGMVKCPENPDQFYNPSEIYGTDPCAKRDDFLKTTV